jgi:hypothetical protein
VAGRSGHPAGTAQQGDKSERVMKALMQMDKLDIAALQQAAS